MAVYYPKDVAEQYGVGRGIGGMLQLAAQSRLEKQKAEQEQAELAAEMQMATLEAAKGVGFEQWATMTPEQQARFIAGGTGVSDPLKASLLEQISSGDLPAALKSPEYKLSEAGLELGNQQRRISQSAGGGGFNWGDIAKGAGGVLSRVADVVSRPVYGVMNTIDNTVDTIQTGDAGEFLNLDAVRGLMGTKKTTGSDVLINALDIDDDEYDSLPGWAKAGIFATGLAADIALDPLTYTGAGLVSKIDDVTRASKALTRGVDIATATGEVVKGTGETGAVAKALAEGIVSASDEASAKLGLRGSREYAEAAGQVKRAGFQPQDVTREAAAIADTEALRAATTAKSLEAGGEVAQRTAERAARIKHGRELPTEAADFDKLSKTEILGIAKSAKVDVLKGQSVKSVNKKTLVNRLRNDPQYRATAKARQAATQSDVTTFREAMFDANQRIATQRFAETTVDRTLALKFQSPMGRKVWGTLELPGISKYWSKQAARLGNTGLGEFAKSFQRSFSRTAQLGKAVHSLERYHVHTNYGDMVEAMKAGSNYLSDIGLKNITKAENDAIYYAIQRGNIDTLDPKLQNIAEGIMTLEDTHALERLDRGLLRQGEIISDKKTGRSSFVPLYFKKYVPESVRRQIRKERIAGMSFDTIMSNPKYAKYAKHIETDLGKIMAMSARDHAERVLRYNFWRDASDRFFLDANRISDLSARGRAVGEAQAKGFVPLKSVAQDVGKEQLHRLFGDMDIDNIWVPPELSDGLSKLATWQFKDPDVAKLQDAYLRIMRNVKLSLTMFNPGFHIRNLRGDIFLNLMDGVSDPRRYRQAQRILGLAGDTRYQGLPTKGLAQRAADVRAQNAASGQYLGLSVNQANLPVAGIDVSAEAGIKIAGREVKADQVLKYFNESGGRTGFTQAEIDRAVGAQGSRSTWQRFKGGLAAGSEYREELPRLAHFIDKLDFRFKEAGISATDIATDSPKLKEAIQRAGNDVRKFNIDYSDLTKTEQSVKNYAVPFYTWMRKNTALQLEMMFTRPAFAAGWSNAVKEAQNWMERDPYGNEITMPWIDEAIGIPMGRINNTIGAAGLGLLGLGGAPGMSGELGPMDSTMYMTPFADTPFANAMEPFEGLATLFDTTQAEGHEGGLRPAAALSETFKFGVGKLAPQVKTPVEIATGTSTFTGGPTPDVNPLNVSTEFSPFVNAVWNMVQQDSDPADLMRLINWFGATNAQIATPTRKTAELARRGEIADEKEQRLKDQLLQTLGLDLNMQVQPPRG